MTMPNLLRAEEWANGKGPKPRAKSVIFLYQFGGPSHIDMFDMKPDAPEGIRGPHKPMSSSADGIQINDRLPRLAKVMDKVTLIRSMHHTMKNHNSASYYALSGHAPPVDDIRLRDSLDLFPAYGCVVDKLAPCAAEIPTHVAYPYVIRDGSVTPGQHASFLGKAHDPFLFTRDPNNANFKLLELSLPANLSYERLEQRRELQKVIDLSSEPEKLRDDYGRHTYGQSCLLARRLVEAGVKFVTVYFSGNIGGQSTTEGGWDTHGFNNTRMYPIIEKYHLPLTNQTLPTFLEDLDSRGLLDTTLVVWMGEFGRTPKINENASRDHWPQCYTTLVAGGGVKRGFVYGASDKNAMYPAENPVRPDDLAATIFYLLGIDPHTEVRAVGNRPVLISEGKPVMDVLA
jgi:hypothetical protein